MSLIKKKTDLELPKNIVGCIYGSPGIGKTTLALSSPKPLLLDTDGGIHRVQNEYRVDCVQVTSYQDVLDVLKEDLSDYETIVIDTLGELVNFMLKYFADRDQSLVTRGGTYNIKIWGLIKTEFANLKLKLKNLNKNLIFVSHTAEDKDGEQKIYRMDVAGSTSKDIVKMLDFLGFCEAIGKKRTISFSPSARYYAKNSIQLDDDLEIPTLATGVENNFLTKAIIEPTVLRREDEQKILKENEEKMFAGRELINNVEEPNSALNLFKDMDLTAHAKVILFKELAEKFKDNFVFNKEKGIFENV
ncbi:MAG: ATP-binding protein [Bacteroidales bacterium]|nr:ATP-binding protein [Bacteroidales bacterium]